MEEEHPQSTQATQSTSVSSANGVSVDQNKRSHTWEITRAFFLSILFVAIIRSFIVEPFKIPSSSMLPTLKVGDHILVTKFDYGLSLPFTKLELIRWSEPKRGEVIVFLFPKEENLHYIKRVIGIPGDYIVIKQGLVFLNGAPVLREEIKLDTQSVGDARVEKSTVRATQTEYRIYKEKLKEGWYTTQYAFERKDRALEKIEIHVPADQFFVMGDNRDDSYDSRSWGMLRRENIKGKARRIWFSLGDDKKSSFLGKVRWDRVGIPIQ